MINIRTTQRTIKINTERLFQDAQKILTWLGYQDFAVSIWITTNKTIRRYNAEYRHKDKPTDILSFPFYPDLQPGDRVVLDPENPIRDLGDLIISAEYVAGVVQEYQTTFEERMRVLLVHGICHLLGYDHITDEQYEQMHALETSILERL